MVKKTDENQGINLKLLSMSSERQGVYNIASYITKHTSELRWDLEIVRMMNNVSLNL